MKINDKPLIWLHGEIKTPPFSSAARIEAGFLFRLLQMGEKLNMLIRGQYQILVPTVTNSELTMKQVYGGLFIESMMMQ